MRQDFFSKVAETVYRAPFVNGVSDYARFSLNGHVYEVKHGDDHVTRVFRDERELKSSPCSNGRHSFFSIGGYRPMAHRLVAFCLLENHDKIFEGYEVNHKTIYKDQVEYNSMRRKILYDAKLNFYWEDERHDYVIQRLGELEQPVTHELNVEELELCSKSDNIKHYHFVSTHDLYDISVSAKDVGTFVSKINEQIDVRNLVMNYYKGV